MNGNRVFIITVILSLSGTTGFSFYYCDITHFYREVSMVQIKYVNWLEEEIEKVVI